MSATLNNWLNRTRVYPLQRVGTFIAIPAWTLEPMTYKGYTELVAAFPFVATNNFSLTDWETAIPSTLEFTLCVAFSVPYYSTPDGSVVQRFQLFGDERVMSTTELGECVDPVIEHKAFRQYEGQVIKKNFRIEVWSNATSFYDEEIVLQTSLRGTYDDRGGADYAMATVGTTVTDFNIHANEAGEFPVPMFPPEGSNPVMNS